MIYTVEEGEGKKKTRISVCSRTCSGCPNNGSKDWKERKREDWKEEKREKIRKKKERRLERTKWREDESNLEGFKFEHFCFVEEEKQGRRKNKRGGKNKREEKERRERRREGKEGEKGRV